jgi:8-amino-3,8-dideoxy-alpha-D-manno-octulosonate transaminase
MCGSMADLRSLKAIADEHRLLLLEDACQAIGGSYEGKPLGSYGHIGCFSFDYVKTITCGEGGGLITDSDEIYEKAQAYSDHGHDHIGSDRGAETHPHLGYNYRIGEVNAAIGLVQLGRLDEFLDVQKVHYTRLRSVLEPLEGVQLRRVPKGGVENYSFLNFFMPDENKARQAAKDLGEAGFDGVFFWYDNNWHYHRKWDHLKNLQSLSPLPDALVNQFQATRNESFKASDHWMGRNLSILVKLSWDEKALQTRCGILKEVVSAALDQ